MYFTLSTKRGQEFPANSTITWGLVLENVDGGYDAASGKFVALHAGLYRFTVTVMNGAAGDDGYMYMYGDGGLLCRAVAIGDWSQTGVCSHVVRLAGGEAVWVVNPDFAQTNRYNNRGFTTFEGFIIHAEL